MEEVRVAEKRLSDYRAIIGGPAFTEILALASKLKGKRVAHVNATGYGGGGAPLVPQLLPPPPGVGPGEHLLVLLRSYQVFSPPHATQNTRPRPAPGLSPATWAP